MKKIVSGVFYFPVLILLILLVGCSTTIRNESISKEPISKEPISKEAVEQVQLTQPGLPVVTVYKEAT
jgi:Na+-transporting methylmalonyl-CoA/oxaloacetate decarboxylase gamma subunit